MSVAFMLNVCEMFSRMETLKFDGEKEFIVGAFLRETLNVLVFDFV